MSLEICDIRFSYGGDEILKGVSMDIGRGVTALLGPNGAGKSTLVKCIAGVNRPSSGTISFDGIDVLNRRDQDGLRLAYLAQDLPTVSGTNVLEMMLLGRAGSLGLTVTDDDLDSAYRALGMAGIEHLADRDFNELSGGQRQMVMVAQCLVDDPNLVIMDEPTNNLDLRREFDMFELMTDITRREGITTLMVLHDVNFASRFADMVCVMRGGEMYSVGTPEETITAAMLRDVYGVEANMGVSSFGRPSVEVVSSIRH